MICFPNCKLNLGLNIIQKRTDGFHDIETVFLPLALNDVLEFIPASHTSFDHSGVSIPGSSSDNIILKAYHLLKDEFPQLPHLQVYLLKNIPTGAGLGGGSADGTFMLNSLNKYFNLGISSTQLERYALTLGSDCPFFVYNRPMFATGRGEHMSPINITLSGYFIIVIHPGIHINTGWAFSQINPSKPKKSIKEIVQMDINHWKYKLVNDFEKPIEDAFPELKDIKLELYKLGAVYSSMSGSGSSYYGIFKNNLLNELKKVVSTETTFRNYKTFFTTQL